jgi:hypothetical protein
MYSDGAPPVHGESLRLMSTIFVQFPLATSSARQIELEEQSTNRVPFFANAGAGLLQPMDDGRGSHGPFGDFERCTRPPPPPTPATPPITSSVPSYGGLLLTRLPSVQFWGGVDVDPLPMWKR